MPSTDDKGILMTNCLDVAIQHIIGDDRDATERLASIALAISDHYAPNGIIESLAEDCADQLLDGDGSDADRAAIISAVISEYCEIRRRIRTLTLWTPHADAQQPAREVACSDPFEAPIYIIECAGTTNSDGIGWTGPGGADGLTRHQVQEMIGVHAERTAWLEVAA